MKIYTGSGDRGKTSLFSGERVAKGHARIEAYGDVDELNSILGWVTTVLPEHQPELTDTIRQIQSDLFHVGAWLATTPDSPAAASLQSIEADFSKPLESEIDRLEGHLDPIAGFILPGGQPGAAVAHVARAVCRRAERHVAVLLEEYSGNQLPQDYRHLLIYLNRLSDYLFVLARYCNHAAGSEDILWTS